MNRNMTNNYPGWGRDKRNDERLKKIIREFLIEVRDEYGKQFGRMYVNQDTREHAWVRSQLDYFKTAWKVLDEIIVNRLQPDKTHAPKAEQIDKDRTDAAVESDFAGDCP